MPVDLPWDEPEPQPKPAPKPEPVGDDRRASRSDDPASRNDEPKPATEADAEAIWAKAKAKMMELNPMVYMYAKDTKGVRIEDDTLTVEFPAAQESKLNGLNVARNLKVAQDAIEAVRKGTTLRFQLAKLQNENEEKLKELFGSSLTIQ